MASWIHENLEGSEVIALSETGHTNETIAMRWLEHFIKHTNAGPEKPWKLLLLDGHTTHENPQFVILAHENNIKLFEYPSHLTHVLQPLDVGVFRPWKHYHNKAIHHALRNLDFEYTITSFFRDLNSIRKNTMKPYTIRNAFRDSGMWPVSCKAAIRKMRQYSAKSSAKRKASTHLNLEDNNELPNLQPASYYQCEVRSQEWEKRVPLAMSSPSSRRFRGWIHGVQVQLTRAQLQLYDNQLITSRLQEQQKARTSNRRSLNSGGPLEVTDARNKIMAKEKKEKDEAIRRAKKAISEAVNKAKRALNRQGINARKLERERRKIVADLSARNEFIEVDLLDPIRDPEKDPTPGELETLKPHPSLVQALEALQPPINLQLIESDGDGEVEFRLYRLEEVVDAPIDDGDNDNNDDELGTDHKSDSEESQESIDSIARQADFIRIP